MTCLNDTVHKKKNDSARKRDIFLEFTMKRKKERADVPLA